MRWREWSGVEKGEVEGVEWCGGLHMPTLSTSGMTLSTPGRCWDTLVKLVLASLMMLPWRRRWFFPPLEAPPAVRCPPLELAELLAESGVALRWPLRSLYVARRSSEAQGTTGGRGPMVSLSPPDSLLPVVVDILLNSAATTRRDSLIHTICLQHTYVQFCRHSS